ncbi:MAG: Hsp70 family protein, partial [Clostridia bacterium]|nr:Hsp70 family protein [Clostridia bacterium]
KTQVEIHVLQGERDMAVNNKTLGRFNLTGIAPAPRGVPQIEVTFDIDANGIVHVSAKDLGTGHEQNVTITASTNLSDAEIDKAVKEAEQFAAEDKKNKELVEAKNQAENMIYTTEKSLTDMNDKISDGEKDAIRAEIEALRSILATADDAQVIRDATEKLAKVSYDAFGKVYQQEQAAQQAAQQQGGAQGETVEPDFEVKDDNN